MSRSGYSEDCENIGLWRGAVEKAIRGKRGQEFLKDLIAALDAMPVKRLISERLFDQDGEVCALGCIGKARGIRMDEIAYWDTEKLGIEFGISRAMAAEIAFENDDDFGCYGGSRETPEHRWARMREWCADNLIKVPKCP